MFPPANLDPQSSRWKNAIENTIERTETQQPRLDSELDALQRENNSVLRQVSSRVNSYYTETLAQYPVFQRSIPMSAVLGGQSKTVSISAPAAADDTVAENWVTIFNWNESIPSTRSVVGVRLNSAQFRLQGPNIYELRFRWVVNGSVEGINTTRWMSRNQFNLSEYQMHQTSPILNNVSNRYVHWSGAATSTLQLSLQATILENLNPTAAVSAQDITFLATNSEDAPTYLDVMVTL